MQIKTRVKYHLTVVKVVILSDIYVKCIYEIYTYIMYIWNTHNAYEIYYSAIKNGNPAVCNNRDLDGIMLNEISQIKTKTVWAHL